MACILSLVPNLIQAQIAGSIEVYPTTSSIEIGSSRQFSAYVPISPNTITWSVNDIPGGNATVGTISPSGMYQAPAAAPTPNVVSVRATSTAYPSSVGTGTLTITRKYPWLWGASPSTINVGNYQVSFNGANFAPDSQALADGVPVQTTYVSPTKLIVKGMASSAGTIKFSVRQPAPGMVTGNTVSATVQAATVTVSVSPQSQSLQLGQSLAFSSTVTGNANTMVTWSVNGVSGGNATFGTISAAGLYTAPGVMPASSTVTIRATSVVSPSSYAQTTVGLTTPPPVITVAVTPTSASLQIGGTQSFISNVTGSANTAVTWSVNGIVGGSSTVGTISSSGVYSTPAVLPASPAITIRATSVAAPSVYAQASVTLLPAPAPAYPQTWLAGARFLEQASFGPTPATLTKVQQLGIEAYLDEQFSLPETPIPTPAGNSMGSLRQWALQNYTTAPDQLRQRVAYALSQILVTSANKLIYADEMLPWLKLLNQHSFGNYRNLLIDVTKSPSMGKFLDLANSLKPGLAGGANENYPRELLQLFTIGLWRLKQDGTLDTDPAGNPVPTYNQTTVQQVALALTGWTYPTAPGATPNNMNWEYFGGPMEPRPQNHDTSSKTFLGTTLPAGQTVEQDLEGVINCLMNHTNIAPFVCSRLIKSLVLSNPSEAYVKRIADVFVDNGNGVRGDLKAVVRAILLDPEARNDSATANQGRLKEPILQVAGFLRALNGQFNPGQQLTYLFDYMAQGVLAPPSVFSWFSPLYRLPNTQLFGPEFQIYTPTEATLRGNLFNYILTSSGGGDVTINLTPFQPYGNDMPGLVEAVNQVLLYGRMPAGMKTILINAASPGYDAKTRIETVLYLTALSGQYAIQH